MAEELRFDMRKRSPAAQEALRMRVRAAIEDGLDDDRAAAWFGVSTKSISRWRARREAEGTQGLRSGKPGRTTGTYRFGTESEEAALRLRFRFERSEIRDSRDNLDTLRKLVLLSG